MQQTLFIFVIEVLLLLLIALIVLLLRNWRKKVCRLAMLEKMIDDFKDNQGQRRKQISVCLTSRYQLDNQTTENLSAQMLASEKQFLLQFIEQQMIESVDGFYENLCELLDSYLQIMPVMTVNKNQSEVLLNTPAMLNTEPKKTAVAEEAINHEPPPNWGDVFD